MFDDSFSALDMKSDARLRRWRKGGKLLTEIIVAQQISTILHADQILVLDDGEIVGKGTHKGCKLRGVQQIVMSQLSAKELDAL